MPVYSLVFTRRSGGQDSNTADFPDDETAISEVIELLASVREGDVLPGNLQDVISIAIGRGGIVCEVEWMGVAERSDGGRPVWTPEE